MFFFFRRQIKGFLGDASYISSSCINTLIGESSIKVLNDTCSWSQGIPLESFLQDSPNTTVLRNFNCGQGDALILSENTEEENLDIYEWHKVYAALFNLEETANKQFDEVEARYKCNTDNAAFIAEQEAETNGKQPTVAWAYYSTYNPANKFWDVASCDEKNYYYCEFAQRCNATLLHSKDGSIPYYGDFHMTDEEFFEFAREADHFIYTGPNWEETFATFRDNLTEFKSVQNGEVYDTQGSGVNAWFETRIAEFGK